MKNERLVNFTSLSRDEKELILSWRNDDNIRKWMYNKEKIPLKDHLNYIESLKNREDRLYLLVLENDIPVGVIDFTSIDKICKTAEIGLYANPSLKGKGEILMKNIIKYAFETLNLNSLYANLLFNNDKAFQLYKKFDFYEYKKQDDLIYMQLDKNKKG